MKRRVGFLLIFGSALSLAVASIAWACGNLATLNLDQSSAAPGGAVTGEGNNYSNTAGTPVEVHLGTREGPVLWSGAPVNRRVSPTFNIPAGTAPGYYTLIATQYQTNGLPVAGAPGRARIQVTGGAADPVAADAAAPAPADEAAAPPDPAAAAAAPAAPAASSRATVAQKKAQKKARKKAARKARGKRKDVVAPWSSSTPPSAPEASSAGAGSLSVSATLPGILVALVMLPTGLILVRSRGGQRADTA